MVEVLRRTAFKLNYQQLFGGDESRKQTVANWPQSLVDKPCEADKKMQGIFREKGKKRWPNDATINQVGEIINQGNMQQSGEKAKGSLGGSCKKATTE